MDLKLANDLARISHAAYNKPSVMTPWAASWDYESCDFFDCNGTQAYVMMKRDMTVLAFRGTEPNQLQDWITDFRRSTVKHPFGKVHKGFDEALGQVWAAMLQSIGKSSAPLFLTGHSLGGALATLATADLVANGSRVDGLYTYGQPRVGNRRFARTFNQQFKSAYRFVNNNDIVPRVPWVGYYHIGELIYLTSAEAMIRKPASWRLLKDRLRGRWRRWVVDGLRDHKMANYKRILAANALEEVFPLLERSNP